MSRKLVLLLVLFSFTALSMFVVQPANAVEPNSWQVKASMNQARAFLGVAVVNGKIYAMGGDNGNIIGNGPGQHGHTYSVLDSNEEYDPVADLWIVKASMPTARAFFGVAVYENKIYCIGGEFASTGLNEVYDPATDTWETKAPMPVQASGIQANTVGGKIYVIGGGVNYAYDPVTDSWVSKTPPPSEIAYCFSAVVGSKICFSARENSSDVVQAYDTSIDSWSVLTASPTFLDSENGGGNLWNVCSQADLLV
jgi:hypothetical protein